MDLNIENKVKGVKNNFLNHTYNKDDLSNFSSHNIKQVLKFQKTNKRYLKTPLTSLKALSQYLGVKNIFVKDESQRFELNAFKVMGGIYAIGKYIAKKLGKDIEEITFDELSSPKTIEKIGAMTFISATDGNHGRGIAWAARELGQRSVIYMPKGTSKARLEAIKREGSLAEITNVNYDETIRICKKLAKKNNWVMVQDTSWKGYDQIPLWVMQGYSSIAMEIVKDLENRYNETPSHVFLQAGVGSFAAGITSFLMQYYDTKDIKVIIVEPELANCYYQSFAYNRGEIKRVTGDMNSIMAGLCCGEPNPIAFEILKKYTHSFYSCPDSISALGMRILGNPLEKDKKIISGESGAVPLGLLYYLKKEGKNDDKLGINESSNILIINTEGDTDSNQYLDIVWKGKMNI